MSNDIKESKNRIGGKIVKYGLVAYGKLKFNKIKGCD